jgi:repressor LexA
LSTSSISDSKLGSEEAPTEVAQFTQKQGQYLAYIHFYRRLHRQGPAESDIARDFRVSPPTVHQMIVKLEELGLITREPGVARSMRVAIPASEIPELEDRGD